MQDVADDRAGRRGDHADHIRQERQELLAGRIEQALGRKLSLALLQQSHERAEARGLERVDHDLILGGAAEGREPAGHNHLEPFLRRHPHAGELALPDHRLDDGLVVLEAEINVAGRRGAFEARHLAAHAHIAVGILDRSLQRR